MLRKDICRYGPQIMRLRYGFLWQGTHFVVGIGRDLQDTTWLINDSHDGREQDITEWANDYRDYRRCIGPEYVYVDKQCSLVVRFHSPGELVITDSLGRREGYDPISDTLYMGEIPSAAYGPVSFPSLDGDQPLPESMEMDIRVPSEGEYDLSVIGTGEGTYDLEIVAYDREGAFSYRDVEQIPIATGVVHNYLLNYSREAGSQIETFGMFDGKGQRPRDVNKFLSFISPTQVTTELSAGQSTYSLLILYHEDIVPGSFTAELNGQDIASQFSPASGSSEVVTLNFGQGRNTLILSVDGTLTSGRVASDKDRLVFIVQ